MKLYALILALPIITSFTPSTFINRNHVNTRPINNPINNPSNTYLSSTPTSDTQIIVSGDNIDLTSSLKTYTTDRMSSALSRSPSESHNAEVHLSVSRNPASSKPNKAEVTVKLSNGSVIRSTSTTADMYTSIDTISSRVKQQIRKFKDRRNKGYHGGGPRTMESDETDDYDVEGSSSSSGDDDDDDYVDSYLPTVTRVKSFDLPPIPLSEAVFALDYIDHDFYVFRDEDTGEVNVVYKRN
eukprot:CAMPEP_0118646052 /NCGR_PEP_ID=MMETSP0785-20121206/7837_1 /TAXON_ID=91992 /ORGANISM="Bolidomonas pacifica, Strain CCMP 1866" /LENGTH=240 /DNA_ID=CAMNT_0006537993 /DNA_START=44 /DNA_END=763 /DNA_ORIENTATION=-